jgi:hypothetical protein
VGTAAATTGIAGAATPAGEADLGSAHFVDDGTTVDIPTLAGCLVDSTGSASSGPVSGQGVSFGGGTSSCIRKVVDPSQNITSTTATVTGQNFGLSALVSVGGPRIDIAHYDLTCAGTQGHTSGSWGFSGMSGVPALPSPVPANYIQTISGADGTALATLVYNTLTQPGDGSTSMTMLTITFAPASGASGTVTVGDAACTPTP